MQICEKPLRLGRFFFVQLFVRVTKLFACKVVIFGFPVEFDGRSAGSQRFFRVTMTLKVPSGF